MMCFYIENGKIGENVLISNKIRALTHGDPYSDPF